MLTLGTTPQNPNSMVWEPNAPSAAEGIAQEVEPTLPPAEIARLAKQFYDDSQAFQRLWFLCRDVLDGFRNYMTADAGVRSGLEMQYFNRARDVSFNITQPAFRNCSSRLQLSMPSWGAVAASYSASDIAKAQADSQMLGYYWRTGELKYVNQEAIDWTIAFGTAATLTELDGENVVQSVFGPDRIRAEPGIWDPDKSRFLGVSRITTKGALKKRFPGHEDAINECQPPSQTTNWWGTASRMANDRIEVLEVYTRSGHAYLLCGDGGTVLWEGRTPNGCMPLQILYYTKLPFAFWGMGMVEQALPAQYAFTTAWNQILNNARLMSNPKILVPQNSGIDPAAFSSRPGEKIFYRNSPPTPWTGSPLPQYAQQIPATAQSALSDMTGVHAASMGKRTAGITTGRAMETLMSADEMQFEHTKLHIQRAIERQGRVALMYMKAYYPEEKVIREFDRYGPAIYQELKASNISQDPDVFVEADTLFSMDVQAVQQRIMSLAQQGAIPPDKVLMMLQNNVNPLRPQKPIADYVDAKKALDLVVAQGFSVPDPSKPLPDGSPGIRKTVKFYPTDNLAVFADVVRQFIRSDEFYRLDPQRQDDVDQYYRDILELMQGPPAPAPGASGGGSPPKLSMPPGSPPTASPGGMLGNAGNEGPTTDQQAVAAGEGAAEIGGT